MDKIIIVVYVNIAGLNKQTADYMLENVSKSIGYNEDILHYIIPTSNGTDSRVESINPKLVSEDDYKQVKEHLDKTKNEIDEILSTLRNQNIEVNEDVIISEVTSPKNTFFNKIINLFK